MGPLRQNPLIVALDVETTPKALALVEAIGDAIDFYKVGLELFTAAGHGVIEALQGRGKKVFLDLKLHDIPATVERATAAAARLGVQLLTVHAHPQVMAAAMAGRAGTDLKVLAVTVLTSLSEADLVEIGYPVGTTPAGLVAQRVRQGVMAGMDGFVCSPLELAAVREIAGVGRLLVTPGVRSAGAEVGDQKRVAAPGKALADGASYLVIGRQITRASDPRKAAEALLQEISTG